MTEWDEYIKDVRLTIKNQQTLGHENIALSAVSDIVDELEKLHQKEAAESYSVGVSSRTDLDQVTIKCQVCHCGIKQSEVSQYAAYGGLPSPCCNICFEANDFRIKSREELQAKSLAKRAQGILEEKSERS